MKDYYEILGLTQNCEHDEIKVAYRKLALKVHPDKNPSEDAKQQFQELQQAYQVLSDPNERTWYDSHKNQILQGDMSKEDFETQESYGFNIWPYFQPTYAGYEDDAKGFYGYFRQAFELIKMTEEKAFNSKVEESDEEEQIPDTYEKLPGFGTSKTDIEVVFAFYRKWDNYTTYKSFSWADQYNPSEAPNRYVKRLIQKDNKKDRLVEKRKYIATIKKLVDMVKSKDPRWKLYLEQKRKEDQAAAHAKKRQLELDKELRQEQLRLGRIAEQERFQENEEYFKQKNHGVEVHQTTKTKNEDSFYCDVCDKEFKSEMQLLNHNNSKMHKSNMKQLIESVTDDKQEQAELLKKNGMAPRGVPQQTEQEMQQQIQDQLNQEEQKHSDKQQESDQKKKKKNKKKNKPATTTQKEEPEQEQTVKWDQLSDSQGESSDEDQIQKKLASMLNFKNKNKNKSQQQQQQQQHQSKFFQQEDSDEEEEEVINEVEAKRQKKEAQKKTQQEEQERKRQADLNRQAAKEQQDEQEQDPDIEQQQYKSKKKNKKATKPGKSALQKDDSDSDEQEPEQLVKGKKLTGAQKIEKQVEQQSKAEQVVEPTPEQEEEEEEDIMSFTSRTKQKKAQDLLAAKKTQPDKSKVVVDNKKTDKNKEEKKVEEDVEAKPKQKPKPTNKVPPKQQVQPDQAEVQVEQEEKKEEAKKQLPRGNFGQGQLPKAKQPEQKQSKAPQSDEDEEEDVPTNQNKGKQQKTTANKVVVGKKGASETTKPKQKVEDEDSGGNVGSDEEPQPKLNAAKLKALKKKQKLEDELKFKCNVCSAVYESKSKLFKHLTDSGHQKATK